MSTSGSTLPTAPEGAALGTNEAAVFLGVAPKTLANWRTQGTGPTYLRYGSAKCCRVAYLIEDLVAFRDVHRVEMA